MIQRRAGGHIETSDNLISRQNLAINDDFNIVKKYVSIAILRFALYWKTGCDLKFKKQSWISIK
jgi:hypothetical protein